MKAKWFMATLVAGLLLIAPEWSQALTPEQVLALKKAGVDEKTIQLMIEQEIAAGNRDPYETLGTREIKDQEGNTVVIYSTGRSASKALDQQEQEKVDRAWEMLQNIIIDTR